MDNYSNGGHRCLVRTKWIYLNDGEAILHVKVCTCVPNGWLERRGYVRDENRGIQAGRGVMQG